MRRVWDSSVRGVATVVVVLALAGNAHAVTREGRDQAKGRAQDSAIVKMVKHIIRALGDGLTIPKP